MHYFDFVYLVVIILLPLFLSLLEDTPNILGISGKRLRGKFFHVYPKKFDIPKIYISYYIISFIIIVQFNQLCFIAFLARIFFLGFYKRKPNEKQQQILYCSLEKLGWLI
eukprot:TRINITY_DN19782_c2_g1_i1.p4 TRINITY_DN19782_c2_g1~~TRINITY_DN19782_c2_g1_i1.p4  ORF type:complete len:110 (-),score=5.29 TRINITY_DN19782_c2_g1_i1:585-914(-)